MIIKWIVYIFIYFGGWILTSMLLFRILELGGKFFFKADITERKLYNKWWNVTLRYFIVFLLPTFYLFLSLFDYYPPNHLQEIFSKPDDSEKIELITNEVNQIEKTLSDIENLTISQIRIELNKTLIFTKKLKKEAIFNQKLFFELQKKIKNEEKRAQNAEELANEIESLSQKQIEAVKFMITKDAYRQNSKSFWIGSVVSFFTGILASYIASFMFSKFGKKP